MLIRFITKNFLSFNEEVEFSMIPGKSRKHPHHIIKGHGRNDINILKAGVIYGANASGKSNLIKAMAFAKNLIVNGTRPKRLIPLTQFKLDKSCANKPSKFEFEFKHKGKFYAYGFELDTHRIYNEWLYEINKSTTKMIFERSTTDDDKTVVEFGNIIFENKKDRQFVEFTGMGTRYNQLFLTESVERGLMHFEDIFLWFDKILILIFPDTRLSSFLTRDDNPINYLSNFLRLFDTGISGIRLVDIDFEQDIPNLPDEIRFDLVGDLERGDGVVLTAPDNKHYIISKDMSNKLRAAKLVTEHKSKNGAENTVLLELDEESDGTQRLIDIIPALIDLFGSNRVYIIDELDRSLHPSLSHKILEIFLNHKTEQESQLIVTTHESTLLNLNLLRRDEVWFVEKDKYEASSVYSLEEFTPRYDKDIRRGYLLGRFGAIPVIHDVNDLGWVN